MIARLSFQPTSCYHDYKYYSVFYGEPFLYEEFIYYYDGRDLRVTGYDLQGKAISSDILAAIIRATNRIGEIRTITAESPSAVSLARTGLSLTREVMDYPSHKYDFEMILNQDFEQCKSTRKSVRKAKNKGLTASSPKIANFSYQHYALIDRFVRRFELCAFYGAEFIASIYHLLSRKRTILSNSYNREVLVGFTLATLIGDLGIIHMTINANDHNGISDILYDHTIRKLKQRGAARISLGFSVYRGLYNYKKKWGANPEWAGSYEILWYKENVRIPSFLWATRIVRRR